MRRGRAALACFLILTFLLTPLRMLQFVALFLALLILVDYAILLYQSRSAALVRRDAVIRSYRDEPFMVEILAENRGRASLSGALLADKPGLFLFHGDSKALISLGPRSAKLFRYRIIPKERGEFEIGPASLSVHDFLGYGEKTVKDAARCRVIIYPRIGKVGFAPQQGLPQGAIKARDPVYEDVTLHRSIRPYSPGDELRRINWKASARTGRLLSNEYEQSLSAPLDIFLNLSHEEYDAHLRYSTMELCIEAAAALAVAAARVRQPVGLVSTGSLPGGAGPVRLRPASDSLVPLLETLARIQGRKIGRSSREEVEGLDFDLPPRSRIAYVGPVPEPSLVELFRLLDMRGAKTSFYLSSGDPEAAARLRSFGFESFKIEEQVGA